MGKYDKFHSRRSLRDRPYTIHPVWRGIGCFLILIIPILAYAGAVLLVQGNLENNWLGVPLSRDLLRTVELPWVGAQPHLYLTVLVTLLLSLVGFAAVMVVYALLARVAGPPALSPLDSEPVRRPPKPVKYTRKSTK